MTCRDVDEILIQSGNSLARLESDAGEHVRLCERCRRMGLLMETYSAADFDPRVLEQISASLLPNLKPVRPLAPTRVWMGVFVLLAIVITVLGASVLGMGGFWAATALQRAVILSAVSLGAFAAAAVVAGEMRPGSKRPISAGNVLAGSSVVIVLAFSLLFEGHGSREFVRSGFPCLSTGLYLSLGTALLITPLLRRGYVLDPANAGMAAGTLAGWTGLYLLGLRCGNLSAAHLVVWHGAILAVSGSVGWLIGYMAGRVKHA